MRLQQLNLIRYGAYVDRSVVLPAGDTDLHVIVGQNEAGKSTLRCAIADLLFGIPARTSFAFLHAYDDLCIGAVVESGGASTEVRRFKRNKQPLRAPDDTPLSENFFAPFLGTATREFFERTFGLDHEQLVNGGLAILEAKDDVSRLLFQSASGIADFGNISDALTQEADQLWGPRASDAREYYRAHKLFQGATEQLKGLTIRSKDWKEAQRAVEEAMHAVAKADQRLLELATTRARLERVRRVAGPIAQRRTWRTQREALGSVALLPKTADAELAKAEADLAGAHSLIQQFGELVEKTEAEQAAVPVDGTALKHEAEIEHVTVECNRTRNHRGDIEKRNGELRVKQETVARIGRDLGLVVTDHTALEALIPPQLLRSRITDLAQQYGALTTKVEIAEQQLEQKEREAADLAEALSNARVVEPGQALLAARSEARALGDVQKRAAELNAGVRGAQARFDVALRGVRPWTGAGEELATLDVVDEVVALDHQRKQTQLTARLDELSAQAKAAEREIQAKELEERQWQRARDPVTPEALRAARDERNAIWGRVKTGAAAPAAVASDYEAKVDAADGVADRRYLGAQDVEQLETLRSAIETKRLEIAARRTLIAEEERVRAALLEGWATHMRALHLEGLGAERYPAWLQARQTVMSAAGHLTESQGAERHYADQVSRTKEALHRALSDTGLSPQTLAETGLTGLLALADAHVTGVEAGKKIHHSLTAQCAGAERDLKVLQQGKTSAAAKLQHWNTQWSASVTQTGLAADIGVQGATLALDAYARLAMTLTEISEIQVNRIDAMHQDLQELGTRTAALASATGLAEEGASPEQVSQALSSRLKQARTAQKLSEQLVKAAADHKQKIREATLHRDNTLARLQPLFARAGVDTVDKLRDAVIRSGQARAIDESLESAERSIAESGDAMALSALEVEVGAEELSEVAAKLEATLAEHQERQGERDRLLIENRECEHQLAQIHGQDDAAGAESDRQAAIAQMGGAIERYVTLRVGARMLRWAIDRYREEKQDPLLKRAGQIFATITLGSYSGLTVDFDGDRPLLKGRRSNGKHVGVEALSSGTRDQLFLALRIAALEQHLDSGGKPLPFIADDLFINFDDQRTKAAFGVLSELAGRTQVIYLTHHTHLASIATDCVGHGLHVIDIGDGVSREGAQRV